MHMGMRMAHVVWKHMGIRMNDMGMRMSGATISMAELATPRRGASMQALSCKA